MAWSTFKTRQLRLAAVSVSFFALAAMVSSGIMWLRTVRAVHDSAAHAASANDPKFAFSQLNSSINPGFRPILATAEFRSITNFDGSIYVCSQSALFQYDSAGKLLRSWTVGQELPAYPLVSLAVRGGIQQPELWIATNGAGVLIWDGQRMRQLRSTEPEVAKVTTLLPLSNGFVLWGTLNKGIYSTNGEVFRTLHSELAAAQVTALAGNEDAVWIGTRNAGVWLWCAGTVEKFTSELPDPQVLSLSTAGDSTWVGTPLGIAEFAGKRFRRNLAEGVFARSLLVESGTLWVGTVDEGTVAVDLKVRTPRLFSAEALAAAAPINATALARIAGKTVALVDDGIRQLPGGQNVLSSPAAILSASHIAALHIDNQRRLWIGYFDRGIDILSPNRSSIAHLENDVLFCVNRIKQEQPSGRVFVGTANGLAVFDSGAKLQEILTKTSGLIANHVTDVLFRRTAEGALSTVVATTAGLTFMEGANISSVYAFEGLVNNHVYTVAQVGDVLLAGTLGGVSLLKGDAVQANFTTANSGLRQNWITASTNFAGEMYLGTYGSGVIRFSQRGGVETFREFSGKRIEISPNALYSTQQALYAGTAGQGLAILSKNDGRWRFVEEGLPSRTVTAIDGDGDNLYVGTDNGLVTVPERELLP